MIKSGGVFKEDKPARADKLRFKGGPRIILFMILVGIFSGVMLRVCGYQRHTPSTSDSPRKADKVSSELRTQCETPATQSELSWHSSPQTQLSAIPLSAYEIAVADGGGVRLKTIVTR